MPGAANPHHAVYAGSFDPLTLGHLDIIVRGSRLFEKVTVGIGVNPDKRPLFSPVERVEMLRHVVAPYPNVEVQCFHGLTVNFVRDCGACVMLRGLRTLTDIEAEFTMTLANHALAPEIETVFLMAGDKYTHISSTLIKQVAQMGRNQDQLRQFVPPEIIPLLLEKFRE